MADTKVGHPATFNDDVLGTIKEILHPLAVNTILDPFAGVGRIHELRPRYQTWGVELEPEWASSSPLTIEGDMFHLPDLLSGLDAPRYFDAIVTSPCLAHGQRILTADLRWVDVAEIKEGDRLLAFDEGSPFTKANGHAARRKYRFADVTWAESQKAECVKVVLENGDEVVTTLNHPWLGVKSAGYTDFNWIESQALEPGAQVLKQFDVWDHLRSFEAGWLSGMLDGEGSLSLGVHGSPKMIMSQKVGPVGDQIGAIMESLGFDYNMILRTDGSGVANHYFTGGFPGLVSALGQLRPIRLLSKWESLDLSSRTIQPERVTVVAVEPVGERDIQGIETTSGTYIGEGYLHHNTYGNRMADHHDAKDGSTRNTYKHKLGRDLSPNNSGAMQWGDEYRDFHRRAWAHLTDTMVMNDGYFILNIKDHIRSGEKMDVTKWHAAVLMDLGWRPIQIELVRVRGNRFGANADLRVDHESVILFSK